METKQERATLVLIAVLGSGAASLMYQVAWTRRLITVTSATATAQAVVLAVFMAGLGLGAWLAGRRAASARSPLRWYIAVEAIAALLAWAAMPLIDVSNGLHNVVVSMGFSATMAPWVQLLSISVYLLVPTTLLGMSLPFVIEVFERPQSDANVSESGRTDGLSIGLIYGINTLGAAIGCWYAGYITIEKLGLTNTVLMGVGLAAVAVSCAWFHEQSSPSPEARAGSTEARGTPAWSLAADKYPLFVWAALFGGFLGLSAEVVWTRLVSLIVLNTVYSFTQVLLFVLGGIALGGVLAHAIHRRATTRGLPFLLGASIGGQLLAALWMCALPWAIVWMAHDSILTDNIAKGTSAYGWLLLGVLLVPPAAMAAMLLPLLAACAPESSKSRSFGSLYAVNTLGSVLGSLLAGFVFLPMFGLTISLALNVALSLALAVLLLQIQPLSNRWTTAIVATAVFCSGMLAVLDLPQQIYRAKIPKGEKLLSFYEGHQSDVMVTQDAQGQRFLWINSCWVASSAGEHHLLGHLPALLHNKPKRALGIAIGTGQTFKAVMQHNLSSLDCVDINRGVIKQSRRWFRRVNGGLFEDPRVQVHHNDGRVFMRTTERKFDLIVLEPLQTWTAGTSNLYSRQFYEEAKRILRPNGVIAQWIPYYGQSAEDTRAMVRTGIEVFPQSSLWSYLHDGILLLHNGRFGLSPERWSNRFQMRKLLAKLHQKQLSEMSDWLSFLTLGPKELKRWTKGAKVLDDDRPFLEFQAARQVGRQSTAPILRSLIPHLAPLDAYLRPLGEKATAQAKAQRREWLTRAHKARKQFFQLGLVLTKPNGGSFAKKVALLEQPGALRSPFVRRHYRELIMRWHHQLTTRRATPFRRAKLFYRSLRHDPAFGKAAVNLSLFHAKSRRFQSAIDILTRTQRHMTTADKRQQPTATKRIEQLLAMLQRTLPKAKARQHNPPPNSTIKPTSKPTSRPAAATASRPTVAPTSRPMPRRK